MRELKFRAWDKFNGIMTYQKNNSFTQRYLFFREMADYEHSGNGIEYMQFTGLKDKNGKEIYEGDIIKGFEYNPKAPKFDVTFKNGCFCWGDEPLGYDFENHDVNWKPEKSNPEKWATIIGNIYENP